MVVEILKNLADDIAGNSLGTTGKLLLYLSGHPPMIFDMRLFRGEAIVYMSSKAILLEKGFLMFEVFSNALQCQLEGRSRPLGG